MNITVYLGATAETTGAQNCGQRLWNLDWRERKCAGLWRIANRADGGACQKRFGCRRRSDRRRAEMLSGRGLCIRRPDPAAGHREYGRAQGENDRTRRRISGVSGGTGTLEEIAEVMSMVSLGQLDAPCMLYKSERVLRRPARLLAQMIETGLSTPERQSGIYFAGTFRDRSHSAEMEFAGSMMQPAGTPAGLSCPACAVKSRIFCGGVGFSPPAEAFCSVLKRRVLCQDNPGAAVAQECCAVFCGR